MGNIKIYAFADEASANIDKQIEVMLRNELSGLEMRNVDGTNVSDITIEKAKEVRKKMDDNGLITWSIGSPIGKIGINDEFEPHLDKFKHTLEVADVLGANNIRLFSFYIPDGEQAAQYKNKVIDRLGQFVELAATTDVRLCHENEKGIYGDVAERCADIHRELPLMKAIFDPANFVQCDVDTLKAWEILKEYTAYMHIKDAAEDGFVVPAGFGIGNVKNIVADFIARGGRDFTIEPHLTVFDGLRDLEVEGETSMIADFRYENSDVAFDAACKAFKEII